MIFTYIIPPEIIGSAFGLVTVLIAYSAITIMSLRERVAKLEEWIRQEERRRNGTERGK